MPKLACLTALAGGLLAGCAEPEDHPPLPEPPDGAELVLALGDLEIYKAFDGELCAGTLRRAELHVEGLAELFEMEPPRARVFLHADQQAVDEVCSFPVSTHGCASWWGAHAMPTVINHELVHVFVLNATSRARTRPAIEEGVAWRLEGSTAQHSSTGSLWKERPSMSLAEFEEVLAMRSAFDLPYKSSRHFFAWAIDRFGLAAVMDAHVATSKAIGRESREADAEVAVALAEALGFATLAELYGEFEATRAVVYPPLPDTVKVFAAEELLDGVTIDTSCAGEYTEGPSDGELMTVVRMEIIEPGEHAVEYEPLRLVAFPPRLQPMEPAYEEVGDEYRAESCIYPHEPLHFVFPRAGQYEVTAAVDYQRMTHPHDQTYEATLSARHLGNHACDPY